MAIETVIDTAAEASKLIGKSGRLAKQHTENKKSATQTIFECIKTALNDYQMTPKQFRVDVYLQAGHPIEVYEIDGKKDTLNVDGEKPHATLKQVFARCSTYHKLNGNLDIETYNDVRNALETVDVVGNAVKQQMKANKLAADLDENQHVEYKKRLKEESAKQAA
jgi:hypothetical protein